MAVSFLWRISIPPITAGASPAGQAPAAPARWLRAIRWEVSPHPHPPQLPGELCGSVSGSSDRWHLGARFPEQRSGAGAVLRLEQDGARRWGGCEQTARADAARRQLARFLPRFQPRRPDPSGEGMREDLGEPSRSSWPGRGSTGPVSGPRPSPAAKLCRCSPHLTQQHPQKPLKPALNPPDSGFAVLAELPRAPSPRSSAGESPRALPGGAGAEAEAGQSRSGSQTLQSCSKGLKNSRRQGWSCSRNEHRAAPGNPSPTASPCTAGSRTRSSCGSR